MAETVKANSSTAAAPAPTPAPKAVAKADKPKKPKPSARHGGGSAKASRRKMRKKKSQIQARRKKEFTYRGNTMEELLKMPLADIIELLPARARRSYIRGMNPEQEAFMTKIKNTDGPVRTHRREIFILPEFVGKTVHVYNGKEFQPIEIKPEMIGHSLGEFALTRKSIKHSGLGVGATRSSKFMPLK